MSLTLTELAHRLLQMAVERGDQPVYFGSFYQDKPVDRVIWEDGYPLIITDSEAPLD